MKLIAGHALEEGATRCLPLLVLQSSLHLVEFILYNVDEHFVVNVVMRNLGYLPLRVGFELVFGLDEFIRLEGVKVLAELFLFET